MRLAHLRFSGAVLAARLLRGQSTLPDPRTMVLDLADLPPNWRRKGSRTFRTGFMAPATPWAERLRQAKGTNYIVSYRDVADPWALIASQAMPFVDAADAAAAFPLLEDHLLTNPDMLVVETRRTPVELTVPLGDERHALIIEGTNLGMPGSQGKQHLALWRHGPILGFLNISGVSGRFESDALEMFAMRQDQRIGAALASGRQVS